MNIAEIRREYTQHRLTKSDVDADPIKQFKHWFEEARKAEVSEPTAMTLATVSAQGVPSARIVLLKDADEQGFVFFTNYLSAKGVDMAASRQVALVFFWHELERQIRVQGTVSQIGEASSQAYFETRPRGSQLGALASQQSQPIENRGILERCFDELEQRYQGAPIPMPAHWGGYRVMPASIEFWQGRASRLHDRLHYQRQDGEWRISRLQP